MGDSRFGGRCVGGLGQAEAAGIRLADEDDLRHEVEVGGAEVLAAVVVTPQAVGVVARRREEAHNAVLNPQTGEIDQEGGRADLP